MLMTIQFTIRQNDWDLIGHVLLKNAKQTGRETDHSRVTLPRSLPASLHC